MTIWYVLRITGIIFEGIGTGLVLLIITMYFMGYIHEDGIYRKKKGGKE